MSLEKLEKICVFGAGAVGGTLAARLASASAVSGAADATSARAVARMVCVDEVAHGNVRDRVARPKSLNRNRNVTVRPVRPAARIRPVIRSIRLITTTSISAGDMVLPARPSAR